jgi:hypothetical protein
VVRLLQFWSVVANGSPVEQRDERGDIGEDEIRLRYRRVQIDTAPVDPGNRETEGFAARQVSELRLADVEDFVARDARMRHEISEQRAVGFVASCTLCGTHQVELAAKRGRSQKIVIDVRDDGQSVTPAQRIEGG